MFKFILVQCICTTL